MLTLSTKGKTRCFKKIFDSQNLWDGQEVKLSVKSNSQIFLSYYSTGNSFVTVVLITGTSLKWQGHCYATPAVGTWTSLHHLFPGLLARLGSIWLLLFPSLCLESLLCIIGEKRVLYLRLTCKGCKRDRFLGFISGMQESNIEDTLNKRGCSKVIGKYKKNVF